MLEVIYLFEEIVRIQTSISSEGGHQNLIKRLQSELKPITGGEWRLRLSEQDAERVIRYAYSYKEDGYQNRPRPLVSKLRPVLAAYQAQHGVQAGLFDDEQASCSERFIPRGR